MKFKRKLLQDNLISKFFQTKYIRTNLLFEIIKNLKLIYHIKK